MDWKKTKDWLFKQWIDHGELNQWYFKFILWYKRKFGNFTYYNKSYAAGYNLVFHDRFETFNKDYWRDSQVWGRVHPDYAFQYSDKSCINIEDGNLVLTNQYEPKSGTQWAGQPSAFKYKTDYTHGEISSRLKFNKGIFEVRCIVPKGTNATTAFWLADAGDVAGIEIDMFEFFPKGDHENHKKQTVTVHWVREDNAPRPHNRFMSPKRYKLPNDITTEMHTHTFIWEDDKMDFLFNGVLIRRIRNKKLLRKFTGPMSIILGNGLTVEPEEVDKNIPKSPFIIDYVKVWQKGSGTIGDGYTVG